VNYNRPIKIAYCKEKKKGELGRPCPLTNRNHNRHPNKICPIKHLARRWNCGLSPSTLLWNLKVQGKIAVMGCVNGEVCGKPWIWIPRVMIEWVNSSNSLFGGPIVCTRWNVIFFIFYLVLFSGGNKGLEPQFCACSLTPVSLC
jgi:hypothetical protein